MKKIDINDIPIDKIGNFKGRNFVTPILICYYDLGNEIYVELSWGTGLFTDKLFGVTCSNGDGTCFENLKDAERWIESYEEDDDEE